LSGGFATGVDYGLAVNSGETPFHCAVLPRGDYHRNNVGRENLAGVLQRKRIAAVAALNGLNYLAKRIVVNVYIKTTAHTITSKLFAVI
jgi:hypothetical protein